MYDDFMGFFQLNKEKLQYGKKGIVQKPWIDFIERELNFHLPESYIWWSQEFEFFIFGCDYVKCITPPQVRDSADIDILYSYKVNLENKILTTDKLSILELEDELYYFLVEPDIENNEYQIYYRDYINDEDVFYANNFLDFLHKKINEL